MNWLRRMILWWNARRARCPHLHFVMYTRSGCHLCAEVWRVLKREQRRRRFALEAVDIDGDDRLCALYGDQIPVVTVDGKVRFRGPINPVFLTRLLHAESRIAATKKARG